MHLTSRTRTAIVLASIILIPAALVAAGGMIARWRGDTISADRRLITPYRLKEIAQNSFPATVAVRVESPSPDEPDRILTYSDREVALLQVRQGQRHVLWQGQGSPARPRPQQIMGTHPHDRILAARWDSAGCHLFRMDGRYEIQFAYESVRCDDRDGNGVMGVAVVPARTIAVDHRDLLLAGILNDRDLDPRGVAVFDESTGQLLWIYRTAQDPQMIVGEDLTGDEHPEILVAGRAPSNGASIGARADSVCCLALLDLEGREIWYREAGGTMDNSHAIVARLSPARERRVVWATVTQSAQVKPTTTIRIIDPTNGEMLLSRVFPGTSSSFFAVDVDGDGDSEIVFGDANGFLRALDGRLEPVRTASFETAVAIVGLEDLTGDERPELIAMIGRRLTILDPRDPDFRTLAYAAILPIWVPTQAIGVEAMILPLRGPDGKVHLATVEANHNLSIFTFETRGLTGVPPIGVGMGLLAALVVAGTFSGAMIGRRLLARRAVEPPAPPPSLVPEIAKTLHREVSEMIHAIDRTNPLVRIQQLFSFVQGGGGLTPQLRERIGDATEALLAEGEPGLVRLVDQVGSARSELPELARLEGCYRELTAVLRDMRAKGFPEEEILARAAGIADLAGRAQTALRAVRDRLRYRLSANLQTTLARVLEGLQPEVREAEVERVEIVSHHPHTVRVLCEDGELFTILSNVISNSIREMRGRPERRLTLRIDPDDDTVDIFVDDTGSGIEKERWEKIFGPGGSTTGGGFGLPHARRVLQQYKGWIEVAASEPGKGTSMQITFQLARRFDEAGAARRGD